MLFVKINKQALLGTCRQRGDVLMFADAVWQPLEAGLQGGELEHVELIWGVGGLWGWTAVLMRAPQLWVPVQRAGLGHGHRMELWRSKPKGIARLWAAKGGVGTEVGPATPLLASVPLSGWVAFTTSGVTALDCFFVCQGGKAG